jgi:hypothetical protein
MFLKLPFQRLARPSYISLIAVLMSFSAWLLPSFGALRKGFDRQEPLDLVSIVTLGSWYALIFFSFVAGQKTGSFLGKSLPCKVNCPALDSDLIYWSFTFLTAIGTAFMLLAIFRSLTPAAVLLYIGSGQANLIGEALHDDYSVGFVSLRYLVVYSTSLALCRIIRRRKFTFLSALNLLMLLMIMTARLIFVATLLMTIFQLNFDKKVVKINIAKAAAVLLVAFSILSAVNLSRNAGFYSQRGDSFFGAGLSEAVAYLGSPFQVAVGTAKVLEELENVGGSEYRRYVDIEEALNTNSAFVQLTELIGPFAWLYIITVCYGIGCAFSLMRSFGRTAFLLPCGAILYGSSELWRVAIFNQGIFITWLVCGLAVPTFVILANQGRTALSRAYPSAQSLRCASSTPQ